MLVDLIYQGYDVERLYLDDVLHIEEDDRSHRPPLVPYHGDGHGGGNHEWSINRVEATDGSGDGEGSSMQFVAVVSNWRRIERPGFLLVAYSEKC